MSGSVRADRDLDNPTNEAANAHLKQGNKFFRASQFERAIDEYQAGAVIEDAPIFFFNLGQSYRFAGDPRNAIRNYTLYLSRGGDPQRIETSEGKIVELRPAADEAERERREREQPAHGQPTLREI
jgi:tetratricopeptide (TPR) repeat protein